MVLLLALPVTAVVLFLLLWLGSSRSATAEHEPRPTGAPQGGTAIRPPLPTSPPVTPPPQAPSIEAWAPAGWRPERPDAPEVRLPSSPLPVIDAVIRAPPAAAPPAAARDLATAQVAMLDRCPGCGRPVVGTTNARQDDQGRRWHLDCRAAT
jgi:hypothetical protein